jgi:putative membrane protein
MGRYRTDASASRVRRSALSPGNTQALDLVKKLNVTPEDNATSQALTKQASAERDTLATLDGTAFDKAMLTTKLPITRQSISQNAELKALLQKGLTLFQAHQHHAEQLAKTLQ